jgi:RNA polymerase sigma-70 factor, ECF subfamily
MAANTKPSRSGQSAESISMSLLGRVKAGEGDAWRRLVDLYAPLLYEWCRRRQLKAEDAADVAQEVFAAVARKIEGFRRERSGDSFRGWLWTITQRKILDHFRKCGRQPEGQGGTAAQVRLNEVAEPPSVASCSALSAGCGDSVERRAIQLARASVEERTWRAFELAAIEGKDPAAVANELGITVQAVYDAKYRIRRRVRQELEGLVE